jgi:hypothetical protein
MIHDNLEIEQTIILLKGLPKEKKYETNYIAFARGSQKIKLNRIQKILKRLLNG